MPGFVQLGIMGTMAGLAKCGLPAVPYLGTKIEDYAYVYWIIIFYFFLLIYYLCLKHLMPLLEELRLMIKLKTKEDDSNLTPEERGPVLQESLWIGLTHLLLSFFHFIVVIAGNTFEESPIGVSTLIGNEVLNHFIQMGAIGVLSQQVLNVGSWVSIRDTVIVCLSCIMFLAFVFFEDSFIMGIFFWIILMIYWVLEVLSKRIGQKIKVMLAEKNEVQFSHLEELRQTRRDRIRYDAIEKKMPKFGDREYIRCEDRFKLLHSDHKSTAKKARIEHKRKLFMIIMRVIFAIRKLKLDYRTEMKIERSKIYSPEIHPSKKDDLKLLSYYRARDNREDSLIMAQEEERRKLDADQDEKEERERNIRNNELRASATIGKLIASRLEVDRNKDEEIVVYKGKVYNMNKKICFVLLIALAPFSLIVTYTLPSTTVTRRKSKDLYWGLIMSSVYMIFFSIIIVWIEDGLFLYFKYPAVLLGFALNGILIMGPHLLHNLSTLNPDAPMFNFYSYFQQLTIFRICCVLGVSWIFELAFKSGTGIFSGTVKSINTGLLVLLCFQLVSIVVIYLNKWRFPLKASWWMIGFGVFLYLGIIGIGFHN